MVILGVDPGTRCGWALLSGGRHVCSGTWDLGSRRHEGGGMRFLRLRAYLTETIDLVAVMDRRIDAVAYEEVRRHMGVDAAHVYGGIVATLTAICEDNKLPYRGIPVGTIKKLATGKGNASKPMMLDAAMTRFGIETKDDNLADALFVALALTTELQAT